MCWSIFCNNNIIITRSTCGPLGSDRLPGTLGDQVPAHNFTCQCYAASRRKNQSATCQSLTEQKHRQLDSKSSAMYLLNSI